MHRFLEPIEYLVTVEDMMEICGVSKSQAYHWQRYGIKNEAARKLLFLHLHNRVIPDDWKDWKFVKNKLVNLEAREWQFDETDLKSAFFNAQALDSYRRECEKLRAELAAYKDANNDDELRDDEIVYGTKRTDRGRYSVLVYELDGEPKLTLSEAIAIYGKNPTTPLNRDDVRRVPLAYIGGWDDDVDSEAATSSFRDKTKSKGKVVPFAA